MLVIHTCAITTLLMCAGSLAPPIISPARNYDISIRSTENVTYVCEANVSAEADVDTVYWALNRRQIRSSDREDYEERQIFIEGTMGANATSTLTVTSEGRQALPPPIRVECFASRGLFAEPGEEYFIELFGESLVDCLLNDCQYYYNVCSTFHTF